MRTRFNENYVFFPLRRRKNTSEKGKKYIKKNSSWKEFVLIQCVVIRVFPTNFIQSCIAEFSTTTAPPDIGSQSSVDSSARAINLQLNLYNNKRLIKYVRLLLPTLTSTRICLATMRNMYTYKQPNSPCSQSCRSFEFRFGGNMER